MSTRLELIAAWALAVIVLFGVKGCGYDFAKAGLYHDPVTAIGGFWHTLDSLKHQKLGAVHNAAAFEPGSSQHAYLICRIAHIQVKLTIIDAMRIILALGASSSFQHRCDARQKGCGHKQQQNQDNLIRRQDIAHLIHQDRKLNFVHFPKAKSGKLLGNCKITASYSCRTLCLS